MKHSRPFRVRVRGDIACFTRPELKVERVSYEVMTPSAARGILEAVFWKPEVAWRIHSISVLAPIRWISFRRNELKSTRAGKPVLIDEDRTQRNTVALRDVDYVIEAVLSTNLKTGSDDNLAKYVEMFRRRLERGQHHHMPSLGCREFAARVDPATDEPAPIDREVDRPLGLMFYDFHWESPAGSPRPLFFAARLSNGVVRVPNPDEVFRENRMDP